MDSEGGGWGEGEGEGEITVEPPWTLAVAARSDSQSDLAVFFKSSSWSNTRISHCSLLLPFSFVISLSHTIFYYYFFYLGK